VGEFVMVFVTPRACDFRLPPRCKYNLRPSGIITQHRVIVTDVSGQPIDISKGQAVQEECVA
jgi:hypothetical protein